MLLTPVRAVLFADGVGDGNFSRVYIVSERLRGDLVKVCTGFNRLEVNAVGPRVFQKEIFSSCWVKRSSKGSDYLEKWHSKSLNQ